MVTRHVPVPEHGAVQPTNVDPSAAVAASSTTTDGVAFATSALQVFCARAQPRSTAAPAVTVPCPLPHRSRMSGKLVASKRAATVFGPVMLSSHGPVPLQAPTHPPKRAPVFGVIVSTTTVAGAVFGTSTAHTALASVEQAKPRPEPSVTVP
jgi:hypothetical protein